MAWLKFSSEWQKATPISIGTGLCQGFPWLKCLNEKNL